VLNTQSTSRTEILRIGKFGLVGVFNTILDFVIYNFVSSHFGLSLVLSNIISTTVAMVFSYVANRQLVFDKNKSSRPLHHQLALFYLVSAFGVYVLQSVVIYILTSVWNAPLDVMLGVFHTFGISGSDTFLVKNAAKAVATIVSLTWNYIMYKRVVFK
jgi:putative flippase GtrA